MLVHEAIAAAVADCGVTTMFGLIGDAGVIASARRPLVLVGRGALDKDTRSAVLEFAQRLDAPPATTLRACNLYRANEGSAGVFGTLSTDRGTQTIADSDCVIAFGASLDTWTTGRNEPTERKAVVHVDIDRAKPGRDSTPATAVHGHAARVAPEFIDRLDAGELTVRLFRDEVLAHTSPNDLRWTAPLRDRLDFAGVLSALNAALPEAWMVAFDGGRLLGEAFKYTDTPGAAQQVLSTSFGAVGLGMGSAIGAACATAEPTALVTGGGSRRGGVDRGARHHRRLRRGRPCGDRRRGRPGHHTRRRRAGRAW
ncbi:hypothetical protein [Streptosporangium sp. NPDC001681]|uniref:hypothetical protein n=1 Tax=Streptosporangium sp. NPDC001681 TaxID=3154395 RepID=UPI0033169F48